MKSAWHAVELRRAIRATNDEGYEVTAVRITKDGFELATKLKGSPSTGAAANEGQGDEDPTDEIERIRGQIRAEAAPSGR